MTHMHHRYNHICMILRIDEVDEKKPFIFKFIYMCFSRDVESIRPRAILLIYISQFPILCR